MLYDSANFPIIFFHTGNASYLQFSLHQAKLLNPDRDIVLLGDQSNDLYPQVKHKLISDFEDTAVVFEEAYVHLSSNTYEFELACFKRWFVLRAFMRENNIDKAALIDSDVLLFRKIEDIVILDANQKAGFCVPKQEYAELRWSASPHVSVWKYEALDEFCDFCLNVYQKDIEQLYKKWNFHNEKGINGGICDMTLLYLFFIQNQGSIRNFLISNNNIVVNNTFRGGGNYEDDEFPVNSENDKQVVIKDGLPYAVSKKTGSEVCFSALHFQGGSKIFMGDYFVGQKKLSASLIKFQLKTSFSIFKSRVKKLIQY